VQVVVTGAGSAFGQAVLQAIVARGVLTRVDGEPTPVGRIIAVDRTQPAALFLDGRIEYVRGDYEQPRFLARMMGVSTDSVFHLSALGAGIGGEATPAGLDAALVRSLDTTRVLLEACCFQRVPPKLVLASTLEAKAQTGPWPQATEGVCAALCELLVAEAARRGMVDGRCVRFPCLVGNRSCSQDLALQALLADIAAGQAPGDAAEALTAVAVLLLGEAAAAMLDAHERTGIARQEPDFLEVAGRRIRVRELAAAAAPPVTPPTLRA